MELYKGITGIFTNPYKRAKKEGFSGFIKVKSHLNLRDWEKVY